MPLLAAELTGPVFALLASGPSTIDIAVILTSPSPHAVLASPSDAKSSVSSPLHFTLSAALSYVSVPPTRCFLPTPSFWYLPGRSSVFLPLPISVDNVVSAASIAPVATPALLRFAPFLSLDLPPTHLPPPPPSLGLFRPPARPLTPPPPALAANIARKDEDVVDWTGRGEARWSV